MTEVPAVRQPHTTSVSVGRQRRVVGSGGAVMRVTFTKGSPNDPRLVAILAAAA